MSIDAVTRACYARALSPEAWEALLAQSPAQNNEAELCASLLSIINSASLPPPTALAYLKHSCWSDHPATKISARQLSKRVFEFSTPESVTSLNSPFNAVLAILNDTRKEDGSIDDTLEELLAILALLKLSLVHPSQGPTLSPTQIYIQRRITTLLPSIEVNLLDSKATARLATILNELLPSLSARSVSSPSTFYSEMHRTLEKLSNQFQVSPEKKSSPTINLDEEAFGPSPDHTVALFLVNDLIRRTTSGGGSGSTDVAAARIYSALRLRISDASTSDTSIERVVVAFFLEMLLAATVDLRRGSTELLRISFAYSRLPELIRDVFVKLRAEAEFAALTTQGVMEATFQHFKSATISDDTMDDAQTPQAVVLHSLLAGFCRETLLGSEFVLTLDNDVHPDDLIRHDIDLSPTNFAHIEATLNSIPHDHSAHSPIASSLILLLKHYTTTRDLASLSRLAKLLIAKSEFLDVIFLYVEPSGMLGFVREFLEGFVIEGEEGFGEPHPLEEFGGIVLFVQIVVARYDLSDDLTRHLGTDRGFFRQWLSSCSATYPLQSMDEESLSTVRGWIAALFGEGISDELIQSTNPRVLLQVAPTICQQAMVAAHMGVIENLKDSLGYFLQGLLSFTLPGVLKSLIGEVSRSSTGTMQVILVDILELFLFSDLLPTTVLELVAPDLRILLAHSNMANSTSIDISRLRKLVLPFAVSTTTSAPTSNEERFHSALVDSVGSPSSIIDLQSSFFALLPQSSPQSIIIKLLQTLFSTISAQTDPTARARRMIVARRTGIALLTSDPSLVGTLIREVLPLILASYQRVKKEGMEDEFERSVELLAGIVGGCLMSVRYLEGDEVEGKTLMGNLRRLLEDKGNASESAFDLFSRHLTSHSELHRLNPTINAN